MAAVFMVTVANRFLLPKPTLAWQKAVQAYDPDLRVFPSQVRPEYRVARVRRLTGIGHKEYRRHPTMHPDTAIALEHNLIFVNWSLTKDVFELDKDGTLTVDTLKRRDTLKLTKKLGSEGDETEQAIRDLENKEQAAVDAAYRDKTRQIGRAARLALLYRTGQRVSLHISRSRGERLSRELAAAKRANPTPSIPPATTGIVLTDAI